MELSYAILAKAADLAPDGTFSILGGGFDGIGAPNFPTSVSFLALLVRLNARPEECQQQYRLRVELLDPDRAKATMQTEVPFTPAIRPGPLRAPGFACVINMISVEFRVQGRYEFRLLVNGQLLGTLPLYLEQQTPADRAGNE